MAARKSVRSNTAWCSLCGYLIPDTIVDYRHPLSGTVDHIEPLSKGGSNMLLNRAPAHRLCNQAKGNKQLVANDFLGLVRPQVALLLERVGEPITAKQKKRAQKRAYQLGFLPALETLKKKRAKDRQRAVICRWEDDGGLWDT